MPDWATSLVQDQPGPPSKTLSQSLKERERKKRKLREGITNSSLGNHELVLVLHKNVPFNSLAWMEDGLSGAQPLLMNCLLLSDLRREETIAFHCVPTDDPTRLP